MQITITIDGDELSMASHGTDDVREDVATAEPAPERFRGFDAETEDVVRDPTPAPARFQPSSR